MINGAIGEDTIAEVPILYLAKIFTNAFIKTYDTWTKFQNFMIKDMGMSHFKQMID